MSDVKTRVRKTTHKYGIEIHTSLACAYEIVAQNVNTFWQDATRKEMTNKGIVFEILENDKHIPLWCSNATGHLIFDVKMTFARKAKWGLDGHKTPDSVGST
eukprot:11966951-Ditylum_brightwellii.AAC.1